MLLISITFSTTYVISMVIRYVKLCCILYYKDTFTRNYNYMRQIRKFIRGQIIILKVMPFNMKDQTHKYAHVYEKSDNNYKGNDHKTHKYAHNQIVAIKGTPFNMNDQKI